MIVKKPKKNLSKLSPDLVLWWNSISRDERFAAVLYHLRTRMGIYSPDNAESQHPHIQCERNGGTKGWNLLESLLLEGLEAEDVTKPKKQQTTLEDYE
jgi:hypothetical protein